MAEVAAGFFSGHGWHGVAQSDALVQGGERAEFHPSSQGWFCVSAAEVARVGLASCRMGSSESGYLMWVRG
jgi:hypothetical protein